MLEAVPLPGNPRPFRAQAGLIAVAQEAFEVVQRRLAQSGHGGAELCYGFQVGFEQSSVFLTEGALQQHFFRTLRRAGGDCHTAEKYVKRRPGPIPSRIDNTEWR